MACVGWAAAAAAVGPTWPDIVADGWAGCPQTVGRQGKRKRQGDRRVKERHAMFSERVSKFGA